MQLETLTRWLNFSSVYALWDEILNCWRHWFLRRKSVVKPATSTPHQGKALAGMLARVHLSDFLHNEHVIASWFQLEQDTDLDSCMLKCLHLRIPHRYQMRRWLRQIWLVLWQIAAGHGLKLTRESICCAYRTKKSQDLMIWEFWLDKGCRG